MEAQSCFGLKHTQVIIAVKKADELAKETTKLASIDVFYCDSDTFLKNNIKSKHIQKWQKRWSESDKGRKV